MAGAARDVFERVDARLMAGWWRAVSVPTARTAAWLRGRRLVFLDPLATAPPTLAELDRTAEVVIERYAATATLLGGAAGLGGLVSAPPELAANLIGVLRMAQRLCVVYGFDPETDRGQMAMWQALANAYGVDLPPSGLVALRASDLPFVLRASTQRSVSGTLLAAAVRGSAWRVLGRVSRFVPLLAAASQAAHERQHVREVGVALRDTLRRLAEVPLEERGRIDDAVEL